MCVYVCMYTCVFYLIFLFLVLAIMLSDAFNREFAIAFEENLSAAEKRRLQLDDRPRSQGVVWCRRAFSDLDI